MSKRTSIKLTGLWENVSASGNKYLKGGTGGTYYIVVKNSAKTRDTDPEYELLITRATKEDLFAEDETSDEFL